MKRHTRIILFALFNAAVIGTTAFFDFRTDSQGISRDDLLGIDPRCILLVFTCFVVAMGADTLKYRLTLGGMTGRRAPLPLAFKVAALGKYYDNITPFGAGGQPFQINYLMKRGYPAGEAGGAVVAGFLSCQFAFIFIAIPVFIFGSGVVDTAALLAPAVLGFLFYAFVPVAAVLFIVSPALTGKALGALLSAGRKLRIVKEPDALRQRALSALAASRKAITDLTRDIRLTTAVFLLAITYRIAMCSMPFFVLRTFGSELDYISVFCTCVFIYLCITFIPTPGNSGVAEGSFYAFFSALEQDNLFWIMLTWRFFCYYLFILTGFAVISLDRPGEEKAGGR
ncbi:MAG: flippase-like domain-containing protein [Oscillospiraceae bacterium]|nr:flippase-like domain-containing protein [Oscillospiraceae bacterium]